MTVAGIGPVALSVYNPFFYESRIVISAQLFVVFRVASVAKEIENHELPTQQPRARRRLVPAITPKAETRLLATRHDHRIDQYGVAEGFCIGNSGQEIQVRAASGVASALSEWFVFESQSGETSIYAIAFCWTGQKSDQRVAQREIQKPGMAITSIQGVPGAIVQHLCPRV